MAEAAQQRGFLNFPAVRALQDQGFHAALLFDHERGLMRAQDVRGTADKAAGQSREASGGR